jgi:hypothetical protein
MSFASSSNTGSSTKSLKPEVVDEPEQWCWPDTSSHEDFTKIAEPPQHAVIAWGIEQSRLRGADGEGIKIDILSLEGEKPGITRLHEIVGPIRLTRS